MKQSLLLLLAAVLALGSCKKDHPANTEDRVGSSRVTRFPTFTMNGDRYMSIPRDGNFTDPGVTAVEGSTPLTVTASGTVDASTVGVYDIVYTAINKDGFPGTVTRTVAVLPGVEQPGVNIAGAYKNLGSFNYTAQMQKLAPGFYLVDNVWGGGSAALIAAYVLTVNGTDLLVPRAELSPYGGVSGTGTLDAAGNLDYRITLHDLGVNNSLRKWKKL
ncbi:DUF5011 domain-containing protein [Flaviaesturariibacter amylovorans]|uniref:Pesticidal crystal protein Cry22Aa Ig-like domain-containing protein n=1 Tax=Flaviaesturariibacter amylovorans TaxID=1084520 RepID=A0ABP8GYY7_9BACT